ncbi:MAG TPA: SprT-like domain-containing protein [Nitrospirales bacterium]|jgi:predicted SprT family Zn-dependent metalloprotease
MLTPEQLQGWWRELNARYFGNVLPPIPIVWSARLTSSAGLFINKVGPRAPLLSTGHPPSPGAFLSSDVSAELRSNRRAPSRDGVSERRLIRLSIPLLSNQPESEVKSTLAHEMIHQWQYDVRKHRPDHGEDFRRIMAAMNLDGLRITVRHSLTADVAALCRYTWRCVQCGQLYHRHRRTIRPNRHRCGACTGRLQELTSQVRADPDRHYAA